MDLEHLQFILLFVWCWVKIKKKCNTIPLSHGIRTEIYIFIYIWTRFHEFFVESIELTTEEGLLLRWWKKKKKLTGEKR